MNSADVVGYSFEADTHCLSCTEARFPGTLPVSEYFDSEGNTPGAIFADEAADYDMECGTCGWRLDGEDNSIYTVTELTEGAIEREEFFPRYQEARATFELWTKEAREFNNSDGDGVFFWDTSLCRMVAEFTGHNGDGGSLVEFGV